MRSSVNISAGFNIENRKWAWILACFLFFLALYGFTARANLLSSDEVSVFETSINLATKHILNLDNLYKIHKITSLGEIGPDNHLYTKYFPGNILGAIVIYRLTAKTNDAHFIWNNPRYGSFELAPSAFGARLALRLNALLGALGMAALFAASLNRFQWRTAILTVLLIGLTTDWWYESRTFFSEIGAGAFLIIGFYFADQKRPYLCSLFLAISLLFRPTNLLALPIWGYAVLKSHPRHLLSGFLLIGSLGLLAVYNFIRFHSFFNFGYGEEGFSLSIREGLLGLLISPGHSLFIYSPILLVSIYGSFILYKRDKLLTLAVLACVVGYILMAASWFSWSGGKVWGTRLLVPILPLTGILLATAIDQIFQDTSKIGMFFLIVLGMCGFGIQLMTIAQNPMSVIANNYYYAYAGQYEMVWSASKNWLILEIKSLLHWDPCQIDSYSLRTIFSQCK